MRSSKIGYVGSFSLSFCDFYFVPSLHWFVLFISFGFCHPLQWWRVHARHMQLNKPKKKRKRRRLRKKLIINSAIVLQRHSSLFSVYVTILCVHKFLCAAECDHDNVEKSKLHCKWKMKNPVIRIGHEPFSAAHIPRHIIFYYSIHLMVITHCMAGYIFYLCADA